MCPCFNFLFMLFYWLIPTHLSLLKIWYRHLDLNQGPTPYQGGALPLSYSGELVDVSRFELLTYSVWRNCTTAVLYILGCLMGFEPTYIGITIRGLNRLTTSTIGGNGEIRTHGPFRIDSFQDCCHKPDSTTFPFSWSGIGESNSWLNLGKVSFDH